MKTARGSFFGVVLGLAVLVATAFAGSYQDTVQSTGQTFSQGTAYGTPSGATVEGYAYLWGSGASAGFWITGAGINEYRSASTSSDASFADYGSGGDIGYQIWASTSGGYPWEYAFSTFVVSW